MSSLPNNGIRGSEPLYQRITDALAAEIEAEGLKPGDQLPSETELMERFGVSRVTVRHALSQLVNRGLIYRRKGKGSFVRDPESGRVSQGRGEFVGVVVPYSRRTSHERSAIEPRRIPGRCGIQGRAVQLQRRPCERSPALQRPGPAGCIGLHLVSLELHGLSQDRQEPAYRGHTVCPGRPLFPRYGV